MENTDQCALIASVIPVIVDNYNFQDNKCHRYQQSVCETMNKLPEAGDNRDKSEQDEASQCPISNQHDRD